MLQTWIEAALIQDQRNMTKLIQQSVKSANADQKLNNYSSKELCLSLVTADANRSNENFRMRLDEAISTVEKDPATWQRGKDRASHILGHIRAELTPANRAHFRTSIADLIESTSVDKFGDPLKAIPLEINTLFDLMTESN